MATRRKTAELVIKANDQYSDRLRKMGEVTGRFADKVRGRMRGLQNLRGPLKLIDDFRKHQQVVAKSGDALEKAREHQRQLLATIKRTKNPTAAMRLEFERARSATQRLESAHRRHRSTLKGLHDRLRDAGVNTSDLAGEQRRLRSAFNNTNRGMDRQISRLERMKDMQDRIARGRERLDRSLATAANLNFVGGASIATGRRIMSGTSRPIRQAIDFESAMSDVRKVVDFESPEAFKDMSNAILELSHRIPMTAEGLAQIVAAGGQSNIPRDELIKFAEMASKVGVAFDVSADRAGTAMAEIKTAMRLTLDETGAIFDAMNHLSNNSAARADKTLDFMNRAGADGFKGGFDPTETLAFGAAMIAAGGGADTAATSFRNMVRALTKGESATKRQRDGMKALGLQSSRVARAMQQDAVGTTLDVLERLRNLPKHKQASVMSDVFGDEARELSKLLNNAKLLPEMLGLVADQTNYLGSSNVEFAERSKTTANNLQLMHNQLTSLGVTVGETVLPALNEILGTAREIIGAVKEWADEHPRLTKWLLIGTIAVGAMAVAAGALLTAAAGLIGTLAVLRFGLAMIGIRSLFALRGVGRLTRGLGRLDRAHGRMTDNISRRNRRSGRGGKLAKGGVLSGLLSGAGRFILKGGAVGTGATIGLGVKPVADGTLPAGFEDNPELWKPRSVEEQRQFISALEKVQAAQGQTGLPTEGRIADLREDLQLYMQEVEAAKAALAETPEFSTGILNPARVQAQADIDAAEAGLKRAEDALVAAEAESRELTAALQVLDSTTAAPEISTASIDNALQKTRLLQQAVQGLPGNSVKAGVAAGKTQFRASGGPFGLEPLVVGEGGAEAYFPNRSGFIANNRQLNHMVAQAARLRRMSIGAVASGGLAALPAAAGLPDSRTALSGGVTVQMGDINITAPSGVSDPKGLATLIKSDLADELVSAMEARFSD